MQSKGLPSCGDNTFWTPDLWCLVDSKERTSLCPFPYDYCQFVLSTSPRRDLINDFKKPPCPTTFYMPIWTESELAIISPYFPDVHLDWHDRFRVLGGIPQLVLEYNKDDPTKLLELASNNCNPIDCVRIVGAGSTITDKSAVVHLLVHMTLTSPFTQPTVDFSSQTALNVILARLGKRAKYQVEALLASNADQPLTASLCGYIFEPYAIEMLENGGEFQCRELVHGRSKEPGETTTLIIQKSKKVLVARVLLNQAPNQLHIPISHTYAAIDAWIPGIGAFQMTVSKRHTIKSGAGPDLAKLGPGADTLYWLLPPLHYHSFTKKTAQEIKQYAMLIPYPLGIEQMS